MSSKLELTKDKPDIFTISLQGKKGFSLYGRKSGRYPIGVEITAEFESKF